MDRITHSPSSLRAYEACEAGWLYRYRLLPKINSDEMRNIVDTGSRFHLVAEAGFDQDVLDAETAHMSENERTMFMSLVHTATSRDYYAIPPVAVETDISVDLDENSTFHGIPDRRFIRDVEVIDPISDAVFQRSKHHVTDWKTTNYPDPYADMVQMRGYGWLLCRTEQIEPDDVVLVLDYVAADRIVTETFSRYDYEQFTNYLRGMFARTRRTLKRFAEYENDITKMSHTPGECTFCPMIGRCAAYRIMIEPSHPTADLESTPTIDLVNELEERRQVLSLYEKRCTAIKQALITRDAAGDADVRAHVTLVSSTFEQYPVEPALRIMLPRIIRASLKASGLLSEVDTGVLQDKLTESLLVMMPASLSKNAVPEPFKKALNRIKRIQTRKPYVR